MLNSPTPTNGLHARQKQHRRQISTPNAFDGVKVPAMQPAPRQRISKAHRRGQSLDIRQQQQRGMCLNSTVSTGTNNTGSATYPQHFDLREAQQQSTQARPGNTEGLYTPLTPNNTCEAMFMSPMSTPQMNAFDVSLNQAFANWPSSSARSSIGSELDLDWNPQSSAQSTPTFSSFPDGPQTPGWTSESDMTRMSSRRSMGSQVLSRVQKFELMSAQGQQRPITPPEQNMTFGLLPTPEETPQDRMDKTDERPTRFAEGYDESMEETLKPVRGRAPIGIQGFFADAQQMAQQQPQASLSRSSTQSSLADSEIDGDDSFEQFVRYDAVPQVSDPSTPHAQMVHENMDAPIAWKKESQSPEQAEQATGHRRKPSRASIVSAQSIEGVNLEESLQDTGVTMEEIDQFICGGPGAADDGKYTCTFEECGKTFGRKENIKSHVQTHLNDRRYLCEHCKKCFVRLHDLKRHAKIHTGIKPYECRCGRTFARHDALTRHRQRGMCVGSFEGAVRASAKRGRPKKARPEMEERQEKATKTRRKNNMSISSVSSMSSAYSSAPSSPATTPREADWTPSNTNFSNSSRTMTSTAHMPMQSKSPMKSRSPMYIKTESCVSPQELMDGSSSQPATPSNGQASRHATPPGLSQTPSPDPIQPLNLALPSNAMISTSLDNLSPESFESSSVFDGSSPQNMSDDQFSNMLYSFGERDPGFLPMDSTQNLLLPQKAGDDFTMFDEDQFFAM